MCKGMQGYIQGGQAIGGGAVCMPIVGVNRCPHVCMAHGMV